MDEINTSPPENPVEVMPTPTPPKSTINKWLALGIFVVVLGAAAAGAFYLKQKAPPLPSVSVNPTPTPTPSPTPSPDPNPNPLNNPYSFLPKVPTKGSATEMKTSGLISWHYPVDAGEADIVNPTAVDEPSVDLYDVGTFNSGKYQGKHISIGIYGCSCMGGGSSKLTIVSGPPSKPNPYIILTKYSAPMDNFGEDLLASKFGIDSTTTITDLEFPDNISGPGQNQNLVKVDRGFFQPDYTLFNSDQLKLVFTDPKLGSVYTSPNVNYNGGPSALYMYNGFYIKSPDWNAIIYTISPSFVDKNGIALVTWNGGVKNTKQYIYTEHTGCGGSNYASVITASDINIQNDLVITGLTNGGEAIYEFKNKNNAVLKDIYDNQYYVFSGQTKIPYDQFVAQHPVFFWVDPFNRLIKFSSNEFVPQAECGKPVIYLYPQKDEDVSVKLNPTGGFSATEPAYGNGWNVFAKPDGQLTNLADNKNYPYLFWEGRSKDIYQTPDKGFVIAKSEVHQFLNEKLAKLGLNPKETSDFEEYWERYMQTAPYYFITFMGNQVMDKIAPLEVSPKPDTIIRVLMDFKPLEKPMSVQGFEIKTPVRSGFTVVEWGGVKP